MRPNTSPQLTRLAGGKGRVPGLSVCARMCRALPGPPGSRPESGTGQELMRLGRFPLTMVQASA